MKISKIAVIGVGGTGAMALQGLAPAYDLIMFDGDDYEDKNITRQIMSFTGENKAENLSAFYNRGVKDVEGVPHYITGGEDLKGADIIFCCVDTNSGRKAAKELADYNGLPLIIPGNETWEPMAFLYLPHLQHTPYCPYKRHDLTNLPEAARHTCAGVEVIEQEPQIPAANFVAAAFGMVILQNLIKCKKEDNYIMEVRATPWPIVTKFLKDLKEEETQKQGEQ